MGEYSRNISKRILHTKIREGYCLICGNYGKLTKDHVPPQGAVIITAIEQRHISELIGEKDPGKPLKGVKSTNGSKFRTICKSCNGDILGRSDEEISRVCSALTKDIKAQFKSNLILPPTISIEVNVIDYCRGMIGHILSATSITECQKEPVKAPYFASLQQFVLGDDDALNNSHDIFYWFYPLKRHLSAKLVGFWENGTTCCMS